MKIETSKDTILIVEDDEDFLFILKTKFESEGFLVLTTKNATEGVNIAEQKNPNIILSDVLMPNMNGIEMAKSIRESGNNVPIVFMTNLKDIDYIKEIQNSKNFACIIKSDTRINEIVQKVKEYL
jgi:DNA-binding response OmpR family regulator